MSQETTATAVTGNISSSFWIRKLHSLSGVVPIGAFLLEHFWTNSYSVYGPQAFNEAVEKLQSLPYTILLEVFLIWLPILFHGIYGIAIALQGRPNNLGYKYARNWMYMLQRLSGIILLAYIGWHVYETRIEAILTGKMVTFEHMAEELSEPGVIIFYLVGIFSAVFHFANGLWAFLIGWGITVTEKAMQRSAVVCTVIGLLMGVVGVNALLGFIGKAIVIKI